MGVAACTGAPGGERDSLPDGGEDGAPSSSRIPVEGGALLIDSSATPQGYGGAYQEASAANGDGGVEAASHPHSDGGWVTAVPAGIPQVISGGGPILASPVLQSITFPNYDLTTWVDDFVTKVGASSYWQRTTSEYGVGPAVAVPPAHLTYGSPGTIDDSQVQTWLAAEIQNNPLLMKPGPGALYVVFYPSSTSVRFDGLQSCFTMGAYHNSFSLNGAPVSYAVVPECSSSGRTPLQTTTAAASHELIEAATDPYPLTTTAAFSGLDADHQYLQMMMGGGEVGDLCAPWPSSFFVPSSLPYMVQRTWSNVAALAGHDPCQPALPGEIFFNAVPTLADDVQVIDQGTFYPTKGANIAIGASKTIDVHLYSDDDVGAWIVDAKNLPRTASYLSFTWDRTIGQNGDTLHLTIHVAGTNADYGGDPFILSSTQGSTTNYWIGYVGQ
jgi:hypothetical protein